MDTSTIALGDYIFSGALFLFDLLGTLLIGYLLHTAGKTSHKTIKTAVLVGMGGLLYQSMQCLWIVITGKLPAYTAYPFWACKDISMVLFAVTFWLATRKASMTTGSLLAFALMFVSPAAWGVVLAFIWAFALIFWLKG
ncbi:hypothetical protein DTO96_102540 [Ephemeroptericola cinctiostellae]|uniref:Uncharacterized protein n=1 Tax=Ephemeroptericola cinctiostellae TaxID=2268024 RepID=A0A345DEJ6_9BURK|nr:hypothetical protein [Ephemeroptericola cinctiostellae]AXF86784.1 hypothetical protein DTO96_102540 [Ephemeroptericola cinctiostellae]